MKISSIRDPLLPDIILGHGFPRHPEVHGVWGGVTHLDKVGPHGGQGQRHPRILLVQLLLCPLVMKLISVTHNTINVRHVGGPGTRTGLTLHSE